MGYSVGLATGSSGVRILLAELHFGTLANLLYPALPVSVGRDTKSRWSLLSGVYDRGSKIFLTGGKCVTCRGRQHT